MNSAPTSNRVISKYAYRDIASQAIALGELDWARDFIDAYKDFLPQASRENTWQFHLATWHFRKRNFDEAIRLLQKVILRDEILYNLEARCIMVAILYETGARDSATWHLDSFKTFLRRHPEFAASRWLSFVNGNVSSFRLAPTNFDAVIHGATDTSPQAAANPSVLLADIVDGTSNVLRQLAATGYRRLLLISSGAVYGKQGESVDSLHEDMDWAIDSLMPADAYGEGKRSAEMQCACSADQGFPAPVVARCFAFVGPYLPAHLAPAQFVHDLLNKGEIVLHGDGTALRSYLDAADLAIWLLTLLARGTAGRAYNVGGAEAISIGELADTIRDVLRPGAVVKIGGQTDHALRHRYLPDTARARAELGLVSWTPLRQSIARMAQAVQVAR